MKDQKVLVAGGTGLVGTHLTKRLIELGADVTASRFSRQPSQFQDNYQKFDFKNYEDCLEATKNKDVVFICAVQASGVEGMKKTPTSNIYPNLTIHAGLLEAAAQNGVKRVVWVSSSTVFQEEYYPLSESDLDLNAPLYPLYQGMGGLYRYLEQLMAFYHEKTNINVGVVRTTSIYGPHDSFEDGKSHVVPALIKRAVEKETPYVIWGNGYTVRDFIYVEDLVEGILKVAEKYCTGKPINFANGLPMNIRDAAKVILSEAGHDIDPVYDEDKPTAIPYRVLKNDKFNSVVGELPRTSFEDGIKKTIEWYRSQL